MRGPAPPGGLGPEERVVKVRQTIGSLISVERVAPPDPDGFSDLASVLHLYPLLRTLSIMENVEIP